MTLLALRLLLGGWASKVWAFLCHRSFWQLVCMGCAVLILVQHFELAHARSEAGRWHKQFDAEHAGRKADRASYVNAQAAATAANKAHVATENKLREQINEASHTSFSADRDRLRAQSGASQGAAGAAGIPPVPKAAPGTPPEVMSLPPAELLRAQELELQLNALIDWVLQQSAIDPNK